MPAARRKTRPSCSRPCAAGSAGSASRPIGTAPDEAASELTTVYMTEFEPIERYLLGRSPQSVRPLEIRFNTLRGEISAGLKGEELADRLDRLSAEVEALVARLEARPAGTFGTAFFESLITIVREGVEVILVLAMLIALVVKASQSPASASAGRDRAGPCRGAMRAIWLGVALAVVASLATAAALEPAGGLGAGPGARGHRGPGDARRRRACCST